MKQNGQAPTIETKKTRPMKDVPLNSRLTCQIDPDLRKRLYVELRLLDLTYSQWAENQVRAFIEQQEACRQPTRNTRGQFAKKGNS